MNNHAQIHLCNSPSGVEGTAYSENPVPERSRGVGSDLIIHFIYFSVKLSETSVISVYICKSEFIYARDF
jgi:hypothetical protein